jgi:site-specific recombinase XerD
MPNANTNNHLPDLETLRTEFNAFTKDIRNTTDSTLSAYNHDIDTYLEFLEGDPNVSTSFLINERTLRKFVSFLRARKNSDSTIQRRLDGISSFWKFLHLEYDYEKPKSPKDCGIRLKNKRNPTSPLSHDQYITFMEAVYDDLRKIE